jgi:arylsulfatase A-like enzyme
VQLNDLYPTVADYVKLEVEGKELLQGQSLFDTATPRSMVWSEGKGYISLRTHRWLWMQWHSRKPWRLDLRGLRESLRTTKSTALFNLLDDPNETHNTCFKHVRRLSRFAQEAQKIWRQNQMIHQELDFRERTAPLDASVEDRLRALGYLG